MRIRTILALSGIVAAVAYVAKRYNPRLALPGGQKMKAFPIEGPVAFSQLFHPGHQGIDIFAPQGTPVVAVANGMIRFQVEPKGGNAAYLVEPDGTQYYYAHLSKFGPQTHGQQPGAVRVAKASERATAPSLRSRRGAHRRPRTIDFATPAPVAGPPTTRARPTAHGPRRTGRSPSPRR